MLIPCTYRFAGDWHTITWLHSSSEASAWEKVVSNKCTTAHFAARPASAREQSPERLSNNVGCGGSPTAEQPSANGTCLTSGGGGGRGADFDVTFWHRPQPQDTTASGSSSSNRQQEAAGLPTVVKGKGSVPLRASPARLQALFCTQTPLISGYCSSGNGACLTAESSVLLGGM